MLLLDNTIQFVFSPTNKWRSGSKLRKCCERGGQDVTREKNY